MNKNFLDILKVFNRNKKLTRKNLFKYEVSIKFI